MDDKQLNLDLETVEQVADMLWLSEHIAKSKIEVELDKTEPEKETVKLDEDEKKIKKKKRKKKAEKEPIYQEKKETSVYDNDACSSKTDIKADPIRMPKKLSLSHYRAWEKSFRSFYHKVDSTRDFVLDEARTVDIIAKIKLLQPIFKAKQIKYFKLIMVIEQSPSMDIWSELIVEFQKTIQRFGVFQNITFYYLASDTKGVKLYADRTLKREINYKKLNLNKGTLVTVVSDCVSSAWHSNHVFLMLELWSQSVPVSITHMFPKRMWQGTSLYKGFQTSFTAHTFQALNKHLKSDEDYYDDTADTFNIPIVNFEPQSVDAWASVIQGKRNKWIDGVILEDLKEEKFVEMGTNKKAIPVEERIDRYLSQASPLAQELALYASVLPINFHVIRILQELKLPKSSQIHLAEFFLGGLIKRELNDKEEVSFDFHDGVRDYFRNQLTATASYRLQELMSSFVSENLNSSLDFQALIDNPDSTSGLYLSKDEVAFVKLRADTLRKLGGDYGRRGKELMKSVVKGISIHIGVDKFSKEYYGDTSEIATNVQDALDMKTILDREGYSSSLLLNEKATVEAVKEALSSASKILVSGDILLISYSGEQVLIPSDDNNKVKTSTWVLYNKMMPENEIASILTLFKEDVRILIFSDSILSISTTVLVQDNIELNQGFYQSIQSSSTTSTYKSIVANVKLITARSKGEHGYAIPSSKNSIFITEVKKVLANGKYKGTIEDFSKDVKERVLLTANEHKIYQTPTLNTLGKESEMFNRQELFSIQGIEVSGKNETVSSSVVLIESKINNSLGTGFCIYKDENGSYILTSSQLLQDQSVKDIRINNFEVNVYSMGLSVVTDLLILYVKGLFLTPLELETNNVLNREVYIIGYNTLQEEYMQNKIEGSILGDKVSISSKINQNTNLWKIRSLSGKGFNRGYTGAPLISKESGKVIGVLTNTKGKKGAYAITIDYLKNRIEEKSKLPFKNLIPLELQESNLFFAKKQMADAVVLIRSKENRNFGTGFVVHNGKGGSYVITTEHILDYTITPIVNGHESVEIIGSDKELDLAVLYVNSLYIEALEIYNEGFGDTEVELMGYSRFSNFEDKKEILEAKIISDNTSNIKWKVEVYNDYYLERGLFGSPLISKESGKVIGLLGRGKNDNEGFAMSIENLSHIWKDMPKNLLSEENNMIEEIEVTEGSTTLLIYMAADNDLDSFAEKDLETIKRASENSNMNIVVQFDRNEFVDQANTIRMSIKNGEVLQEDDLGETNTGDPTVLNAFIEESVEAYPSDKLIVIVWSHGSGVDDHDVYDKESIRERYFVPEIEIEEIALGFDDTAQDFLDNLELQKALDVSVNIDVLGFDACLMGMFEILYQLKEQTSVMVASQHLEPASGWDYRRILNELDTSSTASTMGKQFISFHDDHHSSNERRDVTQSALSTVLMDEVTQELDMFAKVLREELKKGDVEANRKALGYTLSNSQFFNRKDYVDLVDFVSKVKNRLVLEALEPHADKLLASLEKLILANHTIGYFMEDAHGVSIYFPNESRPFKDTFEMYEKLDFAEACPNWVKLLKWYWL